MRFVRAGLVCLGGGFAGASGFAHAQGADANRDIFVRGGLSYVSLSEEVDVAVAGAPVPGAGVSIDTAVSLNGEIGWFLYEQLSVSLSFSGPFETDNVAAGSLAGTGNIASDTFGVFSAGADWHFNRDGMFSPYIGGGLGYFHVFDVEGGAAANVEIDNSFGASLRVGVNARIADDKTLFVDVRRMLLEGDSRGTLGGFPVTVDSQLDPLLVSTGISFEF